MAREGAHNLCVFSPFFFFSTPNTGFFSVSFSHSSLAWPQSTLHALPPFFLLLLTPLFSKGNVEQQNSKHTFFFSVSCKMPAPSCSSFAHGCNLHSQFDIYCLHKPRPTPLCSSSSTRASASASLPEALSLTYGEVVDELDSGRWSFAPYPRCDRSQLLQVHTYWVTVPKERQEDHSLFPDSKKADDTPAASSPTVLVQGEKTVETASVTAFDKKEGGTAPCFSSVVGVVWVRLASSRATKKVPSADRRSVTENGERTAPAVTQESVEGYLQIVFTHPAYRRRGLASWLLRTCLATTEAPASVFASDTCAHQEPYLIQRWHLHTLMAPLSLAKAKQRRCERETDKKVGVDGESSSAAALVKATLSMYQQLGFTERRFLYKYYAGTQDAVELVKQCR